LKILIQLIIVVIFCAVALDSTGQTLVSKVLLRKEQGLNDREANLVVRDSFGFFYVSTDVGIMRYDGREFVSVNTSNLFKYIIDPSSLKSLSISPNGKILVRCEENKALLYIDPGSIVLSAIESKVPMEYIVSGNEIFGVSREKDSYVIYVVDWKQKVAYKKLYSIKEKPENVCRVNGEFVIQTKNGILLKGKKGMTIIPDSKGSIINNQGTIFLATEKSIAVYKNGAFKDIFKIKKDDSDCRILKTDKKGNLIAGYGTFPRFVDSFYIVDKALKCVTFKTLSEDVKISKDVYTDDVNFMWMMAGHHGLLVKGLLRDGASFYNLRPYLKDETFGSVISGIACDGNGGVLFTPENQDLIYLDTKTGRKKVLFSKENGGQGFINNGKIYYDTKSGHFFEFAYSEGPECYLFKIDPKKEVFEKHTIPFLINDFIIDKRGEILICGEQPENQNGILAAYDLITKKSKILLTTATRINTVYYDNHTNTYFVGAMDGLYILDSNFKQISKVDALQTDEKKFIQYSRINVINRYNDKILLGSLGGGLYVLDAETYEVEGHLMTGDGLSDNKVVGIIKDLKGNCWLPTFNGITVINADYTIISVIYQQDGLPNKEMNTKAYTIDENGFLYFGTVNGMVVMNPEKVLQWKKSHGFFINQVQVKYPNKIEVIKDFSIKSNFINMEINYFKPDYIYNLFDNFPPNIISSEKLTITTKPNTIFVSKAEPGSYLMNINFPNTDRFDKFNFEIIRDYTRIIIAAALSLIIFLLVQIISLRKKNIRQKENAIKAKISILELEALQSQMNPHFLFNALGSIQYYIQTENIDKADDYLSDFAQLMRMILESSHNKFIPVSHEIKLLTLYIGLEQIRFNNKFDFEINVGKDVNPEFNIPPMLTQPFIENAINHGLNNLAERKGKLELTIKMLERDVLSFIIKDNGIGRIKSSTRVKSHKSRGTQIVKERVDTLNETNYFNVKIETSDLSEGVPDSGTQVVITFHDMNTFLNRNNGIQSSNN